MTNANTEQGWRVWFRCRAGHVTSVVWLSTVNKRPNEIICELCPRVVGTVVWATLDDELNKLESELTGLREEREWWKEQAIEEGAKALVAEQERDRYKKACEYIAKIEWQQEYIGRSNCLDDAIATAADALAGQE